MVTCEIIEDSGVTGRGGEGEGKIAHVPQVGSLSDQEDGSDQMCSLSEQKAQRREKEDKMVGHVETGLPGGLPLAEMMEKLRDVVRSVEEVKVRDTDLAVMMLTEVIVLF